jgi:hypothetical protein
MTEMPQTPFVPAKAGIQFFGFLPYRPWVPASAGTNGIREGA